MSQKNEETKPVDNMEQLRQEAAACGAGCGCHAAGASSGRRRWVLGAIVLLAAGVLVARALLKNEGNSPQAATPAFAAPVAESTVAAPVVAAAVSPKTDPVTPAALPGASGAPQKDAAAVSPVAQAIPAATSVPATPADNALAGQASETVVGKEIGSLAELNTLAVATDAVFVFLPGLGPTSGKLPTAQMQGAVRTIEAQGKKVGLFTLKTDSPNYTQIAAQVSMPAVLALVKGGGMKAVSGEITETKLVQGFVAASSAGGCGSGGGSCAPGSAGCK